MSNKATIATPGAFTAGTNIAGNGKNASVVQQITRANKGVSRNLRGAPRKFIGEAPPSIPTNSNVGKTPR